MIPSLDLPTENTNEKSIPSSDELKTQTIDWLNEFILSLITGKDGNAFFVNLLGPAQCGKSTLVNFLINSLDNYAYTFSKDDLIYSNLENTSALYSLKDSRLLIYSEASRRPFVSVNSSLSYSSHSPRILNGVISIFHGKSFCQSCSVWA